MKIAEYSTMHIYSSQTLIKINLTADGFVLWSQIDLDFGIHFNIENTQFSLYNFIQVSATVITLYYWM